MKRFYWNKEINETSLESYINFINELPPDMNHELIIDSTGGWCYITETVIDIIDSFDKSKFCLVATGDISSTALDLFVFSKCHKRIISGTTAIVHKIGVKSSRDINGNHYNRHLAKREVTQFKNTLTEDHLKDILSDEEMDAYNAGLDVCIDINQIKKLTKI